MLLRRIELENLLSFKHLDLEMRPLNVLVGPNSAGKSNLIRSLGLVQALPKRGLAQAIAEGGGPRSWINRRTGGIASIHIEGTEELPFDYTLSFQESGQGWTIVREEYVDVFERNQDQLTLSSSGKLVMNATVPPYASVLSEVRHPSEPAMAKFAAALERISLYREFVTGPRAQARFGTSSSLLADHLLEDGGNLAMRINELNFHQGLGRINAALNRFFEPFSEVFPRTREGITQLYVREKGVDDAFAATSLSDGTLRFLLLLTVLLDPAPASLVCIEEPEVGLHPDAIRDVAELLIEASTRTQVIVTTHSPALIDALGDQPEAVAVCERDLDGFTQIRRLQGAKLTDWLERYTLGELWQKGEIGGNRW
jgi:predicted ATPase